MGDSLLCRSRFLSGPSCGLFGSALDRRKLGLEDHHGYHLCVAHYARLYDDERGQGNPFLELINDGPSIGGLRDMGR